MTAENERVLNPARRDVRVLVVDDQQLIRESIASLLDIQPGIAVVGTAADGREAIEAVLKLEPDVALMDVRMPTMDGIEAVAVLRGRAPNCRVVMLTTFDDEEYVVQALRVGASGYLLKDRPARELADAVRTAHAGVVQFDPGAAARLTSALDRPADSQRPTGHPLTGREVEVLRLVASGLSNPDIARELVISRRTAEHHVQHIYAKVGVTSRPALALFAMEHDLLGSDAADR